MLKAVVLNCTLRPSPSVSSTDAILNKVVEALHHRGVGCELIRVVDHPVRFGVERDLGAGDAWPMIVDKILAAEILVIGTPIWLGHRSSVCQMVMERLDALLSETNRVGQLPLYNKVAGSVVVGNEDGAQEVNASVLYNLMQLGCTIPPNSEVYWVAESGSGGEYVLDGQPSEHVAKLVEWMASNLTHFAETLRDHPIPADGNTA